VRPIGCASGDALLITLKAPTITPPNVGAKLTLIWQLWPALKVVQLFVCANPPLTPTWLIVNVVLRLLVRMTV